MMGIRKKVFLSEVDSIDSVESNSSFIKGRISGNPIRQ